MSQTLKSEFEKHGQGHVFRHWDRLDAAARERLVSQCKEVDLDELERLHRTLVKGEAAPMDFSRLEPAPYVPHVAKGGDAKAWAAARERGEQALRNGEVAAFVVAGGQGTRLGYDGPKGTFPVTPVLRKTLFEVFADKIRGASELYGRTIPWLIMTSHANHEVTVRFFKDNNFFGLAPDSVRFFTQGRMPATDKQGRLLLEAADSLVMSPDGHGGSLRAMVRSGAVADMQARGVKYLSYFQVDNPLVKVIDPVFIGYHILSGSEMSSKMLAKAFPTEKVGNFCIDGGKTTVVEYSDLPDDKANEKNPDGSLRFLAGSIAIHMIDIDFVSRVGSGKDEAFRLPFHRADKKIPYIDDAGDKVSPSSPNGVKFEMFVFDALPFARKPLIIETLREDDFSPVKNAEGIDSPATCKADQLKQWARWLKDVGVSVPVDDKGVPSFDFEVSCAFADNAGTFASKWKALAAKPAVKAGTCIG